MTDELSPTERKLASELGHLATDPDASTRISIMRAVMGATRAESAPRQLGWRWRFLAAAAAAVVLLSAGTVGAFAASSNALPKTPAYQIRLAGEEIRLTLADQRNREQLRIGFARDRFRQAQQIAHSDRADAQLLVDDGRGYLIQTRKDLGSVPSDEQGQVQNQLNQAEEDQNQTQNQIDQQGQP